MLLCQTVLCGLICKRLPGEKEVQSQLLERVGKLASERGIWKLNVGWNDQALNLARFQSHGELPCLAAAV